MSALPSYLTAQPRWLLWRMKSIADPRTGELRTTKIPISYHTSKPADVTAPASWADHAAVEAALVRAPGAWDGPGFALGVIEPIGEVVIGLDLDTCLDDEDALAAWALPFLQAMPSYSEVSPSGTGIKVIARIRLADLPAVRRLLDIREGEKEQARTRIFGPRVNGTHAPGAQLFLMRRFFTITGRHWPLAVGDVALLDVAQIDELAVLFGPRSPAARCANGGHHETEDDDTAPDDAALRDKLQAAFVRNPRLRERWEGGTQGLNDTTRSGRDMSVLAMLVTAGFTRGETHAALCWFEHGKVKDEPPRYFGEMWRRTKAAPRQDLEPPDDREAQHPPPTSSGPPPDSPEVTELITAFNRKYFVLNENGRAVIYAPKHDAILNRRFFERLTFADLDRLYSNRVVKVSEKHGEPVFAPVAGVWLRHRNRKQFIGGMVFDPSPRRQPADVLNLWQGFAVTPRAGSWQLLKEHTSTVICRGDDGLFNYLLDWMADLVRQPGKQGEVCVVLCGPEGTGKGILARAIKYLLGQHGLAISNSKHLTGNFNAHLRDVVFLFADEAFYAGDKAHVGVLKSLVTEPYLTIEGKYQNAVQLPNYLHIMMASNEMWVVPASLRSRRWLVLDVDDSHANDHDYFAAIQAELEHGGCEAMLHELLERTPVGNLRKIPVTVALQTQRKLSLGTTESWWLDCLHRGFVFRSKLGLENHFGQWHEVLATDVLVDSYTEFCRAHHERHPRSRELLGQWLRTVDCKPTRPCNAVVGEHIGEVLTPDGHTRRAAELVRKDRAQGYHLGCLDAARQAFARATGLATEWDG